MLEKKKRRRGIVDFEATGGGIFNKGVQYKGVIEFEELERAGDMIHIKVIRVSGARLSLIQNSIPHWINEKESDITWIN